MKKFISGADKGLQKIQTVNHKGCKADIYRTVDAEKGAFCLELFLPRFLTVPEMTELVSAAIMEAEKHGVYILDAQSSFVDLNGIRQAFDIRSVRW